MFPSLFWLLRAWFWCSNADHSPGLQPLQIQCRVGQREPAFPKEEFSPVGPFTLLLFQWTRPDAGHVTLKQLQRNEEKNKQWLLHKSLHHIHINTSPQKECVLRMNDLLLLLVPLASRPGAVLWNSAGLTHRLRPPFGPPSPVPVYMSVAPWWNCYQVSYQHLYDYFTHTHAHIYCRSVEALTQNSTTSLPVRRAPT